MDLFNHTAPIVAILALLSTFYGNTSTDAISIPSTNESHSTATCLTKHCIQTASRILSSMDENVDPCDDFYAFACNGWIRNNPIPDGNLIWDTQKKLFYSNLLVVKKVLERPLSEFKSDAEKKAKSFYESCLDADGTIEKLGAEPLQKLLRQVGGWNVTDSGFDSETFSLVSTMKLLQNRYNVDGFFEWKIHPDTRNSSQNIIAILKNKLYLPSPEYYLNRAKYAKELNAYANAFTKVAVLLGANAEAISAQFERMLAFETRLAEIQSGAEILSTTSIEKHFPYLRVFQQRSPFIDWNTYFDESLQRVDSKMTDSIVVFLDDPVYHEKLSVILQAYNSTGKGRVTLSNYLIWQLVRKFIPFLSKPFRETINEIGGVEKTWSSCIDETVNVFGFAIVAMLVRETSRSKRSEEQSKQMASEIRLAFKQNLPNLLWLDAESRTLVEDKVDAIVDFIGYPDYILHPDKLDGVYGVLEADPNQYFENNIRSNVYERMQNSKLLGQPMYKAAAWYKKLNANAQYIPNLNSLSVPTAIIRLPFFDSRSSKSLNFGAIGMVIGHELSHAFDRTGIQYDKFGNVGQWLSMETMEKIQKQAACFTDQYGSYEIDGNSLNGKLTLGENMADNAGLNAAFRAFIASKSETAADSMLLPGLNMTHRQLFFVSFAQSWCMAGTDQAISDSYLTDEHAPHRFRVIGTLLNSVDFAREFGCPLGSPYNPVDKCEVW